MWHLKLHQRTSPFLYICERIKPGPITLLTKTLLTLWVSARELGDPERPGPSSENCFSRPGPPVSLMTHRPPPPDHTGPGHGLNHTGPSTPGTRPGTCSSRSDLTLPSGLPQQRDLGSPRPQIAKCGNPMARPRSPGTPQM